MLGDPGVRVFVAHASPDGSEIEWTKRSWFIGRCGRITRREVNRGEMSGKVYGKLAPGDRERG